MGDAPFRELFVELPRALFETLQGIGEAAVAKATTTTTAGQTLGATRMAYDDGAIARWLCQRFGWVSVTTQRSPALRETHFCARMPCRHWHVIPVDDQVLYDSMPGAFIDAIDAYQEDYPRSCYCTPRAS